MEKIFNFFKRRSLAQKVVMGASGVILILGIIGLARSEDVNSSIEKIQGEKILVEETGEGKVVPEVAKVEAPIILEIETEKVINAEKENKDKQEVVDEKQKIIENEEKASEKIKEVSGSDIEGLKSEFEKVYSGNEVDINLEGNTLKVIVSEAEDHPLVEADEMAISNYTDWTLGNMKDDIKYIDIKVERPNSSVRSKLDMRDVKTDNGKYFYLGDIIKGLQKTI